MHRSNFHENMQYVQRLELKKTYEFMVNVRNLCTVT